MNSAAEFLKRHNQSPEQVDAEQQILLFCRDMERGLQRDGQTIPMIPTYLCNVDRSQIKGGKRILIDAGGTNFRSALGSFEGGKILIERQQKRAMPASGGETLGKSEFYDSIAQSIAPLCDEGGDVGFCFSYPVDMESNLDGKVKSFSTEVKAPQVIGTYVGAETLAALKKYDGRQRKIAILNDTVATLLGGMAISQKDYSTYLGYIYGTGTNLCCIVDTEKIAKAKNLPRGKMLINMECGGYDKFPMGDFDKKAAAKTDAPDSQLYEKMTSGKYLSEIMFEALCTAAEEGHVSRKPAHFDLKDVSALLEGQTTLGLSAEDVDFASEICRLLIRRAAKLGAIANTAAAVFTAEGNKPVAIVAEGTTFNKLVGYRACFESYLAEYFSRRGLCYEVVQGEDLNLVGTLMATMAL